MKLKLPFGWKMPLSTKVITGCESDGTNESPYLYRTTLLETKRGSLYLHKFVRSDRDVVHDHPWDFVSLILWPGYLEQHDGKLSFKGFGSVLRRPATWQHRVELLQKPCPRCNRSAYDHDCYWSDFIDSINCPVCKETGYVPWPCWSLVWTGPKFRVWGFWEKGVNTPWHEYFKNHGCR